MPAGAVGMSIRMATGVTIRMAIDLSFTIFRLQLHERLVQPLTFLHQELALFGMLRPLQNWHDPHIALPMTVRLGAELERDILSVLLPVACLRSTFHSAVRVEGECREAVVPQRTRWIICVFPMSESEEAAGDCQERGESDVSS